MPLDAFYSLDGNQILRDDDAVKVVRVTGKFHEQRDTSVRANVGD